METMKILVTGGSAFIGSTISESLSTKYKVISPTSQQLNLLNASDVKDYLNKNSFDIVIHSANHLVHPLLKESKEPSIQLVNNLKMFFNIAINKNLFGKMIYFGSGAEFGRENWKSKMKESYFGNHYPADQYGLSKYFMNTHTRLSKNIYNLRLFGMYGTKDDWRFRFIPYICAKAFLNENIVVNQNAIFGFLYVEDLVHIVERFIIHNPDPGDYNVCNNEDLELIKIAEIVNLLGNKKEIIVNKSGISTSYSGDNSKLMKLFPEIKFTPIEEGTKEIFNYYSENPQVIDKTKFLIK